MPAAADMTSSIDRRVWPDFGSRRSIPRSQPSPSPPNPTWGHHGAMHTDPSARTPSISRPAPHVNQIPLEPNPTLYTGWNAMGAQVNLNSGLDTNANVFSSFYILETSINRSNTYLWREPPFLLSFPGAWFNRSG